MEQFDVLITGAGGFLGSVIVDHFLEAGHRVIATDYKEKLGKWRCEYKRTDIRDEARLGGLFHGQSHVVHAAGLAHVFQRSSSRLADFYAVNVVGCKNVARAAARAGVHHLVLISSVSVYGGDGKNCREDSFCKPSSPYAQSKYSAERMAAAIAAESGMAVTVLRLVTLYGEGDPGNVSRLIKQIDDGRFFWIGSGSNRKSLLYVKDAAKACLAVTGKPSCCFNVYNVSGSVSAMHDVVNGIAHHLGRKIPRYHLPDCLALGIKTVLLKLPSRKIRSMGNMLQKWLADDVYDGGKFASEYRFEPETPLSVGLQREVSWFQAGKKLQGDKK